MVSVLSILQMTCYTAGISLNSSRHLQSQCCVSHETLALIWAVDDKETWSLQDVKHWRCVTYSEGDGEGVYSEAVQLIVSLSLAHAVAERHQSHPEYFSSELIL
jgi:hypothetical protein